MLVQPAAGAAEVGVRLEEDGLDGGVAAEHEAEDAARLLAAARAGAGEGLEEAKPSDGAGFGRG